MWDELTRASECKKDEVRDPTGNGTHRIHWIEMRMADMCAAIVAGGYLKFGDEFHLSTWKLEKLRKYYHRRPGRNVCLCRYHMDFDQRHDALRKWKLKVCT